MNSLKGSFWNFRFSKIFPLFGVSHFLYQLLLQPKTTSEDLRRREFILNVILLGSVALVFSSSIYILYRLFHNPAFLGPILALPLLLFLIFVGLLTLSRKGFFIPAAYVLIGLYFIGITYAVVSWGADLPQAILSYALVITMASILVSSWFGFAATLVVVVVLLTVSYLQRAGLLMPQVYWKQEPFTMGDSVVSAVTYLSIMLVSWLFNHEMEKSLERARNSEAELKQERDLLEIKVDDRTQELRAVQLKQISELSRSAEVGRLASGLFHDLINPLTALSLSMQSLKDMPGNFTDKAIVALDQAFVASKRMEMFISALRKQIKQEQSHELFFLEEEIKEAILLLSYNARRSNVIINFFPKVSIQTYNSPLRFHQVVLNLILNAIEACDSLPAGQRRWVEVDLQQIGNKAVISVEDSGVGMTQEQKAKVFQPFFTTKTSNNIGIGLSTVKHIVEKEFHGTIDFETTPQIGTTFRAEIAIDPPPLT